MSTSDDILLISKENGLLRLTLNRPERRNALNDDLIARLTDAFTKASSDPEGRVIVLGATGEKAFCSGADLKGGTFTITNHGTSGSLFATPIINQPQCGILGAGTIQKRPVVVEDAIAIRPMVYLSLTFDHRILDSAIADYFLAMIKQTLETWA